MIVTVSVAKEVTVSATDPEIGKPWPLGRGVGLPVKMTALLACLFLITSACTTPVGVKRIDPRAVHRTLTASILSADTLSNPTQNVLYRRDCSRDSRMRPRRRWLISTPRLSPTAAVERYLRARGVSFLYATNTGKRSYFLASVVYAYAFLFPGRATACRTPSTRGCG